MTQNENCWRRAERALRRTDRARRSVWVAREDSDYDVTVFLKDLDDRWAEMDKIAVAADDILAETGAVIHAMPYRAGSYQKRTPLMHELRREGIDV